MNIKKSSIILFVSCLLCSCTPSSSVEQNINSNLLLDLDFDTHNGEYVVNNANNQEYKISLEDFHQISLTPGENENMLNFCWYDKNLDGNSQIKIWEKDGDIKIYKGSKNKLKNGFVTNKVTVRDLKENTTYYYSYNSNGIWSEPIEYRTKNFKNFNFVFMGDPQIGA